MQSIPRYGLLHSLTISTGLDSTLQLIARRAQSLTLASGAAIALRDKLDSTEEMVCRASAGEDAPSVGARLRVGSGFSGECVRQGRSLCCDDTESDARVDAESCRNLGIRSILAVPVKAGDAVIGIIELFSSLPGAFTEIDAVEIERLAELVSGAVEKDREELPAAPVASSTPASRENDVAALPPVIVKIIEAETGSSPELFGTHIFVPSSLPWNRFLQSALWHVVALVAIWNVSFSWARSEQVRQRKNSETSHLTYQPSFPTSGSYRAPARPPAKQPIATQRTAVKPRFVERGRTEAAVSAPSLKVAPRARLNMAAWTPAMPARAIPTAPVLDTVGRSGTSGQARLLQTSVIAPPPQMGDSLRQRPSAGLGASVVAPSPSVELSVRMGQQPGSVQGGVVAPPPEAPLRHEPRLSAMSLGGDGSAVAPAPNLSSLEGQGSGRSMAVTGGVAVVAPPPGLPMLDRPLNGGAGLNGSGNAIVPPSPSMGGSENLANGTGISLGGSAAAGPSNAIASIGNVPGAPAGAMSIPRSVVRPSPTHIVDEPNGSTLELPVRVIGLAFALPTASYFSNYEVFIAERRVTKEESQLIKLVYESRPYQRRISEYGLDDSRIYKVRLKRDAACDETAVQMSGNHYPELKQKTQHGGLNTLDPETVLPCYRTTVDEYRKAVGRGR